jgi:hypothetical protein
VATGRRVHVHRRRQRSTGATRAWDWEAGGRPSGAARRREVAQLGRLPGRVTKSLSWGRGGIGTRRWLGRLDLGRLGFGQLGWSLAWAL